MTSTLEKNRLTIARKVRELRRARKWTQAELAKKLQTSQGRLSELEKGAGSFTAEQLLVLLQIFNAPIGDFAGEPARPELQIQNALARLGAIHLQESLEVLPTAALANVHAAVKEALAERSPRILTALAPVLVRNADLLNPSRLLVELERTGLARRFGWLVENTLTALARVPVGADREAKQWSKIDRRAEATLGELLEFIAHAALPAEHGRSGPPAPPDILDAAIRSKRSLDEVRRSSSPISQRWGIVTSLQVEDFLQALVAARAAA